MQVVTANRIGDGRVVFQTMTGWGHDINLAEVWETPEALAAALERANAAAADNRVVEPYSIEVKPTLGGVTPVRLRERIRVEGPTTGNSRHENA